MNETDRKVTKVSYWNLLVWGTVIWLGFLVSMKTDDPDDLSRPLIPQSWGKNIMIIAGSIFLLCLITTITKLARRHSSRE